MEQDLVKCADCHTMASEGGWQKVVVDRTGQKILYANLCHDCIDSFNALIAGINWSRAR